LDDAKQSDSCFLCDAANAGDDAKHLVLARSESAFVIMNRYPYNPGHLMIVPYAHVGGIEDVTESTAIEMWNFITHAKQVLHEVMRSQGYNVGINQGACAGAGVADHLHWHIVPRWEGDSNFMPVLGDTRVISQALDELYDSLLAAWPNGSK
jgi:ATP adenylyltransferase